MTERREKRNEEIRIKYRALLQAGKSMMDALESVADEASYGLSPDTVRKIVHDKKYCRANKRGELQTN
jgi:hypothetical protein